MNLDLSRLQFAMTSIYHFVFVPITLGTVWFVVGFQTAWVRTGNQKYLRLTKFFGKLFLINFAMGVVTGIVQEFQFGMNWSDYSRFVGDVFGAPLAMEGLLAFFLESTFLGLWIFGWDRLPKRLHLATIWAAAFGTLFSAYFILAANAWMQHPVGYEISETTGRAVMNDIGAVLFQPASVAAFVHTITAAFVVGGAFVASVAAWHLAKGRDVDVFRPAVKAGAWVILIAALGVSISGSEFAKVMVNDQPMKIAAAEGLYETTTNAPFSLLTIGDLSGDSATPIVEVPGMLSYLATGSVDGTVQGINNLQAQYVQEFGPGDYVPYVPMTYWSFRAMIGFGMIAMLYAVWALWRFRGGRSPRSRAFAFSTAVVTLLPLAGISAGWIFTEVGRQPWIVFGLQTTADGVSPVMSSADILISFFGFLGLYIALAIVEVRLMLKAIKAGPPAEVNEDPYGDPPQDSDKQLYFAY
ncbi:MAG: cytochrome ubiquinol oxidase subunit I [Actinomycetota bacterium]|nr:cytochrome ubiquinol oxidase subunit I [Actinomycetota bacterium]MDP2288583.1 cytochrome ubiquinol oxidase subunit I [Actinomycetota bacterium]